jgi:hypothetical protein
MGSDNLTCSGNFIVGDGLLLEAFRQYVGPALQRRFVDVADIFRCQQVLVSLKGGRELAKEGLSLEQALDQSLIEAASRAEADYTSARAQGTCNKTVWEHQFMDKAYAYPDGLGTKPVITPHGKFKVIGLYTQDGAASEIFPSLALRYAAEDAQKELERLAEKAKNVFRRFNQ